MKSKTFLSVWTILFFLCFDNGWATGLCFRGKPSPDCKMFLLTEFSVAARVAGSDGALFENGLENTLVIWEYGLMKNVNQKFALGGSLAAAGNLAFRGDFQGVGIKPRVRYWMKNGFSADFSPLFLFTSDADVRSPAVMGIAALNWKDYLSVSGTLEFIRVRTYLTGGNPLLPPEPGEDKKVTSLYLGAKVQSLPGLVTGIGMAVGLFIAALGSGS